MSKSDSSRIQSTQAKGGDDMSSGGFAARAQAAGDRSTSTNTGTAYSSSGSAQQGITGSGGGSQQSGAAK
ncbi:hypothetical protein ASPACDRAFT_123473 [Aspergillus aculeatus ATCC 16872]|uniref:SMP domain-containing protein n=1 Tax=Aspergillus aculeatus (strain ATCC 16872 / CBS 172.66 / WB 5094) TaxID=690307 RepID=A0A1L9WN56_ASPA1|nr:uncharacterized protein ASPACDRAFT_123473 [Aspergillus aculeatus ATCC 16872]OJJ97560.1 hypothetical protein ASPACDRAFT_123473 [Aspergillus aculeatus ATCC 16872]